MKKPVHNILTVPNGDVLYNSFILIDEILIVGGLRFVSSIGINATDNNNETKINGS